jgi:hypothetical protein
MTQPHHKKNIPAPYAAAAIPDTTSPCQLVPGLKRPSDRGAAGSRARSRVLVHRRAALSADSSGVHWLIKPERVCLVLVHWPGGVMAVHPFPPVLGWNRSSTRGGGLRSPSQAGRTTDRARTSLLLLVFLFGWHECPAQCLEAARPPSSEDSHGDDT